MSKSKWQFQTTVREERKKLNTALIWKLHGIGILYDDFGQRIKQIIPDVKTMSVGTTTLKDEKSIQEVGGRPTKTNSGTETSVSLTFQGNAHSIIMAILGKDAHVYSTFEPGYHGTAGRGLGDLEVRSFDDDGILLTSQIYCDCVVKITELPGAADGENDYSIMFIYEDSKVINGGKVFFSHEVYVDRAGGTTGSGVTQGPDGSRVAFTMGHGNYSYKVVPTAGTLNVKDYDPDATGLYKTLIYARVTDTDGNVRDVTDVELASFTGQIITFGTAIANDYILETLYMIDATGTTVLYQPALSWAGGRDDAESWVKYQDN